MGGIPTGSLRMEGGFGISRILNFSMKEYPGEHSRAKIEGIARLTGDGSWGFEGMIGKSPVEIYAPGQERPLYSGIIQEAESREENGVHLVRLTLASGSILLDMEKKSRSYQDITMTYGQVVSQALAASKTAAVYPAQLDAVPIGMPVIQYQETDWEFVRRMASRFGFSVYPEPVMGGAKVYLGIPETGDVCEMDEIGYTARMDRCFYENGGEAAGYNRRQFLTYEVESWEDYRVGDRTSFRGKELYILGKRCENDGSQIKFSYILACQDWAGTRRISNEKISGMSLLGTVSGCQRETVSLKLDIDEGYPTQQAYAWNWVPATGNVMYMMPQAGTRVSLYFKGEEESSAIAVNCIRSGNGCAGADYRDKTLTTEHGMQLRLCQGDMGVVTLENKVMLDDLNGISIKGSGTLHVMAYGTVRIKGKTVTIYGKEGVETYEGKVTSEGSVTVKAMITLTSDGGDANVDVRGTQKTYYLAWEHGDLGDPAYRFRDAPEQKNYDYAGLAANVTAGVVVSLDLGLVTYGFGTLVVSGSTAAGLGFSVCTGGTWYVGTQAVSDALGGRVSSTDTYLRKALAGSVAGFLTGASSLASAGAGLGKTMGIACSEVFGGSVISQYIIDGEIKWDQAIADGLFFPVMAGVIWSWRNPGVKAIEPIEDTGEPLYYESEGYGSDGQEVEFLDDFYPGSYKGPERGFGPATFYSVVTEQGKTVYVSTGNIVQSHFSHIIDDTDVSVTLFTGAHGDLDGLLKTELSFWTEDIERWGNIPRVNIVDVSQLSASEIASIVNSSNNITIFAWCYSERSEIVLRSLGLIE